MHPDEDGQGVGVTAIIRKGNMTYARATALLQELVRAGLVAEADSGERREYRVTQDGFRYLVAYQKFEDFAMSFGLKA
jgi:predicted transcriptional regulator